jgi:hypothetical protein
MKRAYLVLFLLTMALSASGDSVRFTRIQGGPPPPGVSHAAKDMGTIEGDGFNKIRPQIQSIISTLVKHDRWLPKRLFGGTWGRTQGMFLQSSKWRAKLSP